MGRPPTYFYYYTACMAVHRNSIICLKAVHGTYGRVINPFATEAISILLAVFLFIKWKECVTDVSADRSLKIIVDARSLFDFWHITQSLKNWVALP